MVELNNKFQTGMEIKLPVSFLFKPIQCDVKKLIPALAKFCTGIYSGKADLVSIGFSESVASLGIQNQSEKTAWTLVLNAIAASTCELITEYHTDLSMINVQSAEALLNGLKAEFECKEIIINKEFFDKPQNFVLIPDIQEFLKYWFRGLNIYEANEYLESQIGTIVARFPAFFVYNLHKEWVNNPSVYQAVFEAIDSPFINAVSKERTWLQYNARLVKQVNVSIFGEPFSLSQIYVPLRGYYKIKKKKEDGEIDLNEIVHIKKAVCLKGEILDWLKKSDKDDAIRLISGGPGSGKSSFAKMLAAELAESKQHKVLFIPMHLFDYKEDLIKSVGDFLRNSEEFSYNPLEPTEASNQILIIFDGLDELAMMGKIGADSAKQFADDIERFIAVRNTVGLRIKVLISGRDVAVQSTEAIFKKENQILHLLPYYINDSDRKSYEDADELLIEDHRTIWWKKYGNVTGKGYKSLPEELNRKDFIEITEQPLLNYLIALSYERGGINFNENVSLNSIYDDLLKAVYARGWQNPYKLIRELEETQFRKILQEIALSTWHGDGRTTTIKEIQAHCEKSRITKFLEIFQEGAEKGVVRLLSAFYFRKYGQKTDGEQTFEFTHKSFGEYLTALRIIRCIRDISIQYEKYQSGEEFAWDEVECLRRWIEICGPTALSFYLFSFIQNEIKLVGKEEGKEKISFWQGCIIQLINYMLKNGMPIDKLSPRKTYREEHEMFKNSVEALFAILCACSGVIGNISKITWPENTSAGDLIQTIQGQRSSADNRLIMKLARMDFHNCIFYCCDFYNADFANVNFKSAKMEDANLRKAYLYGANLRGANLRGANLRGANLRGADLREANLREANLREANLSGADLRGADLRGADLSGANLRGADLSGADLRGADLRGADLREADLREVHFREADLSKITIDRENAQLLERLSNEQGFKF